MSQTLVKINKIDYTVIHWALWCNQTDLLRIFDLSELNHIHQEIIDQFKEDQILEVLRN